MIPIALGPFELHEPIGRGGMGEVWRGAHRASRAPVAIKLLTGRGSVRPYFLAAFRNEVRAMAGLDHPYVAMVLDHGEVQPEEADASQGLLQVGYPYIAMELAEGGSLAPWCGRLTWRDVREILACLLDALAHAHARGVIHRDLKPGNVLLGDPNGPRPGVKLSDFGLAQMQRDTLDGDRLVGGTPYYMAPEQSARRRVDQGPATDLYGLGRLTLALLWGSPMPGPAQLQLGPSVPAELHPWLARLLHADPADRFACAADALVALDALGVPELEPQAPSVLNTLGVSGHTFVLTQARTSVRSALEHDLDDLSVVRPAPTEPSSDVVTRADADFGSDEVSGSVLYTSPPVRVVSGGGAGAPRFEVGFWGEMSPAPTRAPQIALDWRRRQTPAPPPRLLDAGLGLCGLRAPPMVGREAERDALWEALRAVSLTQRASAVVLRGPAGSGTSRLAEWLCERAHELGAANAWRVTHSPSSSPSDGLGPAIARAHRCAGLTRPEVLERMERLVSRRGDADPDEALALTELIQPSAARDLAPGERIIRFANPSERHALVRRLLTRLASDRPHIVWIDDAQWGLDALAFTAALIREDHRSQPPVLVVLSVTDEELAQRPASAEALAQVIGNPTTGTLTLTPLTAEQHAELVRGLLGLEGPLAARVEERTAGNPMFAVQLLGDWVLRGLLEPSPDGYRLKAGSDAELPQHIYEVWAAHLQAILQGRPDSHGLALELAAVLGMDVDVAEWRMACAELALEAPYDLVEALMDRRLARAIGDPSRAWSFAHGMLRETVERRAKEANRHVSLHRAAANMLRAQLGPHWDTPEPGSLSTPDAARIERLGRHSVKAGDHALALRALTVSIRAREASGDYAEAEALLDERQHAETALQLGEDDKRRVEGWLLRGRVARFRGRVDEAVQWHDRAREAARRRAWIGLYAEALGELGALAWGRGQPQRALDLATEAVSEAHITDDRALLGQLRMLLASMLRRRGARREAEALYRRAAEDYRAIGDQLGEAYCLHGLGDIARLEGRTAEARRIFEGALEGFEAAGAQRGLADCLNTLGEVARLEGNLDEAEARYRASLSRLEAIGAQQSIAPACNLGLVLVEEGRYAEASARLNAVMSSIERFGPRIYLGNVRAYLLPCLAASGEWSRFDQHLIAAEELLRESQQVELDVARMAETAGRLATEREQTERARAAYSLAERQWRALDRLSQADAALHAMSALPPR